MQKTLKKILIAGIFAGISVNILAANTVNLTAANTNIFDKKSLQNGAYLFMNNCSGCHSISFMRYNRLGKDLGIADSEVRENLMFNASKIGSQIISSMPQEGAVRWFGATPPDLSLSARSRGTDWIYTYLHSFYSDPKALFGVNNKLIENVSMPDVLWHLKQSKSPQDFDKDVRDITNFLDYVSEPAKLIRINLGYKVLGFLLILLILAYLLKKEYWKDVKYGKWRAKK
ncbi:MAG: cytochrome c1 [Candidatus Thioglobus sp.]|nr:cytochrome c1 [Candidatus Thioglobus sp.]